MSGVSPEDVTKLVERAVESARRKVPDTYLLPGTDVDMGVSSLRIVDVAPLARAGLDGIERMAVPLGAVGSDGAARAMIVLSLLSAGRDEEARSAFLANEATFEQIVDAVYDDAMAARVSVAAREEAWREIMRVVAEVGQVALKLAVPILLAAL